ncbi:MAG: hypothetical protein HC843_04585 [Sphingomonadales bacterium]|nr:hypothetical protein [Sphingomonadales bacterium]
MKKHIEMLLYFFGVLLAATAIFFTLRANSLSIDSSTLRLISVFTGTFGISLVIMVPRIMVEFEEHWKASVSHRVEWIGNGQRR